LSIAVARGLTFHLANTYGRDPTAQTTTTRTSTLLACLLALATTAGAAETDPIVQAWPARQPQRDAALEARVEATLKTLTLRQKVGQITQPEIRAITPDEVRDYGIGTVLNGGGG